MNNELSNSHPEPSPDPVTDQARVMKAAARRDAEKPIFRPFRREFDNDYWRRVDDAIDDIKLREFEKEEGFC